MKYDAIILTDTKTPYRIRPLGAYVIANSLREEGYSCLVLDFFTDIKKEKLFSLLEKFIGNNTVFVGYSSSLFLNLNLEFPFLGVEKKYFVEINNFIKKLNDKTKIIFGGSYTPQLSEYCLKNKENLGIDYLMHGYSESMIKDFMKNHREQKSQKFSKKNFGLYEISYDYRGDSFNFCDEKFSWHNNDLIFENETLPLELSRGCIFKCKFCAYPLLGKNKNDLTYLKREENIVNELLSNYDRFKTKNYFLIDDTFNERTDKLEILLRARDRAKLDLTFVGYNRLDLVHRFPEQISLFKDLNFKGHFFGIETLNYESAKLIGKGLKEKDALDTLLKIKKSMNDKVNIACGFIVGLPKENMKTFSEWFGRVLENDYLIDTIVVNPLFLSQTTHTKSEFFSNPEKYGYLFSETAQWKNEYWDSNECNEIVNHIREIIDRKTERNKVSSFYSIGLSSLDGGNFDLTLNVPIKNIDTNFYATKHLERVEKYVDRLESL